MDKAQVLRAFNDHFQEFIDDALRVFPGDKELRTVATTLHAIRKANPRLILSVFSKHIAGPYRDEIERGDAEFFVEKNWSGEVRDSQVASKSVVLDKIERMRETVSKMDRADKDKSMGYVRNLARIADLYSA